MFTAKAPKVMNKKAVKKGAPMAAAPTKKGIKGLGLKPKKVSKKIKKGKV